MKATSSPDRERKGVEIAGEALNLIRVAPFHIVSSYFIGSVPFILGLLYFWSDMSKSAFAPQRCFNASLGLAALFIWMKCWQSVFASGLKNHLTGTPGTAWTFSRISAMIARQTSIQPYGLLMIPLAMLLLIPFYAVHSFYQNATVMENGDEIDSRSFMKRAWKQGLLWPKQNHVIMWLLSPWVLISGMITIFATIWFVMSLSPDMQSIAYELDTSSKYLLLVFAVFLIYQLVLPLSPFGCIVAGNIAIAIILLPYLSGFLFGVETNFALSGIHGIMNTSFIMTVYGLSYLCLDPVIKAAYVLRCFYGDSRQSGQDLLIELDAFSRKEE